MFRGTDLVPHFILCFFFAVLFRFRLNCVCSKAGNYTTRFNNELKKISYIIHIFYSFTCNIVVFGYTLHEHVQHSIQFQKRTSVLNILVSNYSITFLINFFII